ncbi:MAG: S41 family peptidase [Lachnospiraceae bacterium]|nr:S41 family peptidase [Lachnospiraceae bacterium]
MDDRDLMNVSPAQQPAQKERFHQKEFWIGLAIGLVVTLLLSGTLMAVMLATGIFKARSLSETVSDAITTGQENYLTGGMGSADTGLLDDATEEKLNYIYNLFEANSIYDIEEEDLRRGMIDGMLAGTGDKYALYYSEEELNDTFESLSGTFYGIGALLFLNDDGYATISSVYADSPAERAGLLSEDIITKVDDEDVLGLTLDKIVSKIRGPEGTEVKLTVYRGMINDYLDLTCTRGMIKEVTVEHEMEEDRIGYIRITTFEDVTVEQFADALEELKDQGMKGLVIDLRSNTGGLLSAVVSIADEMLPDGLVVYTEDANGKRADFKSYGSDLITVPVVVLTNGLTASASEILTGALQDHGVAVSMGTKTYGKGVVQSFVELKDGSGLKLTTDQYFTPHGRAIDGEGIAPDIEVEFDADSYYADDSYDNQKAEAIKYLKEKIK